MIKLIKFSEIHRDSLFLLLNNRNVSDWLLEVPYPYSLLDAYWWINKCSELEGRNKEYHYAIHFNQEHVGGIGMKLLSEHHGELGFWLGERHWGKGIMKDAISELLTLAFGDLGLKRVSAEVFEENIKSEKLLLKCGFEYEGTLRKLQKKGDNYINCKIFAIVI
ncbi:MAG TPA: GNAT family N-acetyltransferase [Ignavibacteria bacterium]|nr:GNAT family N-acetyltransferase [Ignavibacteria bacterium]